MFVSTTLGYSYNLAQQKKLKMGHKNVLPNLFFDFDSFDNLP